MEDLNFKIAMCAIWNTIEDTILGILFFATLMGVGLGLSFLFQWIFDFPNIGYGFLTLILGVFFFFVGLLIFSGLVSLYDKFKEKFEVNYKICKKRMEEKNNETS